MKHKINRLTSNIEKTETLMNYILKRKRENIQKNLIRPLYQEILKTIFFVIILIVDTLIPLQIYFDFTYIINILLSILALSIFLYLEIRIYNLLWGKNGCWSIDKYKNKTEKR